MHERKLEMLRGKYPVLTQVMVLWSRYLVKQVCNVTHQHTYNLNKYILHIYNSNHETYLAREIETDEEGDFNTRQY